MSAAQFETLADGELQHLSERLEEALADDVDIELQGGILTLEFDDGSQYVINKHAASRQIWLSSPVSGAWHFDHDAARGAWTATRGGRPLRDLLAEELAARAGRPVALD